ncbi:OmpA family protein [Burkholderia alba]|uniref:OmpA family protein n=1 Tax=Burkholderia alba TaxID=2683677 RepID=UPI002B0519F1|nr:OmpA family protein [Burkholderia alba]
MKRKLWVLASQFVAAALLVPALAHADVILVPPPGPRHERVPPPRHGQAWHPGYWRWDHGGYAWAPGVWVPVEAVPGAYRVPVAPPPPPPPPRVERLSADALFPFDRGGIADLRPEGRADLAQIAARLRANPFGHVEVRGYTDRLGTDAYNLDLSQRRADAVKAVLIEQGVPADKIRAEGLGSQDPIVQCQGSGGDALIRCLQPNRRVDIVTYVRDEPRWQAQHP